MEGVVVIGATNRPDMIDTALIRPGRFDRIISTAVPSRESREKIFNIHTKDMPISKDVKLESYTEKTDGYVGADIAAICREAAMLSLREDINSKEVKKKHFDEALKKVKASLDDSDIKKYKEVEETFRKSSIPVEVSYFG